MRESIEYHEGTKLGTRKYFDVRLFADMDLEAQATA